jgi:hypothetical protein
MRIISKTTTEKRRYRDDRGAALITMLLVSVPLLMAGGALVLITSMSVGNSADSAAETEAYYSAEAGAQSVLNVMRGNVAPNSLSGDPNANKISFKNAVTTSISNTSSDTGVPRLSRWLSYDGTYTDRVTLTSNYTSLTGMAFSTTISDPDNSSQVKFSTSGVFPTFGGTNIHGFTGTECGSTGNGVKVTVTFTGQALTTINNSGNSTLGYFTIAPSGGNTCTLPNANTLSVPFNLTITQTAPWPVTYTINTTLSGVLLTSASLISVTFPTSSNNLQEALYTRLINPSLSNQTTPIAVTVTAPEPNRLVANITGYGPRSAKKQMQMMLSRFAFDFFALSAIALRSADDNTVLSFNAGNSAQYTYSGYDNAGGQNLSAFSVTSTPDYNYVTGLGLPGNQTQGSPSAIQQVSVSSLPSWLQTADAARAFVNQLRTESQNQSRYFTTASPPASFGTSLQPMLTFVDGDGYLPPAGGAGLLVCTGILTLDGNASFDGLILALGGGQLIRSGGGNGGTLGSAYIARFASTGNFLAPTFNSNGSGTSALQYDSAWARRALTSPGPRVMGISEY